MKRVPGILLALALLLLPVSALADYDYNAIPTPNMIVVDADDPSVVFYERAADQKAYPASTTKIMTCLIALEAGNLDEPFAVGDEVLGTTIKFTSYSSLMGLVPGETVTLRDLVYGLMLVSGNDAGEAIAKRVSGSVDGFVSLMNQKAAALGMADTRFTNPHGVQNDGHYTTARDMAKLASYALQNADFCQIAKTLTYTMPANNVRTNPLVLTNTNRLLQAVAGDSIQTVYPYAIGVKTGDTDAAGKCLVAAAERDGARVIVVLFGDKAALYGNDTIIANLARFANAAGIFNYVFENEYQSVTAAELGLADVFYTGVVNANPNDLVNGQLVMRADLSKITIRARASRIEGIRASASAISASLELTTEAKAPIIAGQSMGVVRYELNGETVCTAPLMADFAVGETLGISTVPAQETAVITNSPDNTPLISKGRKDWGARDFLTLTFVLLVALFVALIVIFILSERKRRYERKRRAMRARKRSQY